MEAAASLKAKCSKIRPRPVGCGAVRRFQAGLVDGLSYEDLLPTDAEHGISAAFHLGERCGHRLARLGR